ncbi:hypothetical protein BCR34DRAFT_577444 [Clohesyomyces aquaticus]|uniref:F-box domain-containing protein n=1 Tax=Clohesyomyces aquaticus TaxID=1231657 RepID=A0A1Y1YJM1_9PLEO|nr:hypothetical protein BCR34DRAFT_577444 [Clohesyomyces aquaticus]
MKPVQSSQAPVALLELPKGIRIKIYGYALVLLHPVYIFQEAPGSRLETFAPDKPKRNWLGLLYTNRQIHNEASAVLYRVNHFHLMDMTPQQAGLLESFLNCVGPTNAAAISRLCINFPVTQNIEQQLGTVKLRDDSLRSLVLLRDKCTNLSTLDLLVHYKNSSFFRNSDGFLREALSLINSHFKSITALKKIVVRCSDHKRVPNSPAKQCMEELGWEIVIGD